MTLTKDLIAVSLQSRLGVPKSESFRFLESVLEIIKSSVTGGDDVFIRGLVNSLMQARREDSILASVKVKTILL